jgi:hypothetical protein
MLSSAGGTIHWFQVLQPRSFHMVLTWYSPEIAFFVYIAVLITWPPE